ncbi:TetR/AcrR family transcriptional regulator [Pseudonocardia sp. GCM10023141]|uniref:TetR/AcrR family transcriptional regulator n=1 Tax=Pseudonocardia sp. GCM10023141 TaxID=3252653 RepID=UPI003606D079
MASSDPGRPGPVRRMPRAERREQLLDVALELIADEGYSALTMEALARAARIAKTVVYAQFADRNELLTTLLEREQRRATAAVVAAMPIPKPGDDPLSLIRRGLTRYFVAVTEHPATWRLILLPVEGTPASARAAVERQRERFRRDLEGVAFWTLKSVRGQHIDAELVSHLVLAGVEQLARLALADPGAYPPDRLAGFVADLVGAVGRAAGVSDRPTQ